MRALRPTLWAAVALATLRAFRAPPSYALGQWLVTWRHGLVGRGLVGTVVAPALAWKTPTERTFALQTLAGALAVGLAAAFVGSAVRQTRAGADRWTRAALASLGVAIGASGWAVYAGHTDGFFDHVLELLVLAGVAAAGTRWRPIVPILAGLGALIHEEFLLYGLPALVAAEVLHADTPRDRVLRGVAPVLVALAAAGAVALGDGRVDPDALRLDLEQSGVLSTRAVDNVLFRWTTSLAEVRELQGDTLVARLTRADVAAVAVPPLALLGAWTLALGWRAGLRGSLLAWPAVVGAPLALHAIAWDTPRFTLMAVFQGWAVWCAAARRLAPIALPPGLARAAVAAAGVVLALDLSVPVPLLDDEVDGDGPLAIRAAPTTRTLTGCAPAFRNADLELGSLTGWTVDGVAFEALRATTELGTRTQPGSVGTWLARSTDESEGALVSPPFELVGDQLLLAVGGEVDHDRLTVSLVVDDVPVLTATGPGGRALAPVRWSTADWRVQRARIEVRDRSPRGHLAVDNVCWYPRVTRPAPTGR
jgi:hypothetical protein